METRRDVARVRVHYTGDEPARALKGDVPGVDDLLSAITLGMSPLAWIIHGAEFVAASVGDCEQSPCEFMSQAAAPGRP